MKALDDKQMSGNPPTDVEKILEAMAIQQEFMLAVSGDEDALTLLKAREEVPDGIKAWLVKKAADETGDGKNDKDGKDGKDGKDIKKDKDGNDIIDDKDKDVKKTDGEPKREDFETELEFAKALVRWDRAQTAQNSPKFSYKKPEPEDFATDELFDEAKESYDDFVKSLKEDLEPILGDAIKKTILPDQNRDIVKVDIEDVFTKGLGEKIRWEDYKSEENIQ